MLLHSSGCTCEPFECTFILHTYLWSILGLYTLVFVLVLLRVTYIFPTLLVVLSVQLVNFIQDLLYYLTILNRYQYQRWHRMVGEYANYEAAGNTNPPATSNNSISAALSNLAQNLATIKAGNTSTWSTHNHAPFLDHFASDLPFDVSSRDGSTTFLLRCLAPLTARVGVKNIVTN